MFENKFKVGDRVIANGQNPSVLGFVGTVVETAPSEGGYYVLFDINPYPSRIPDGVYAMFESELEHA